MREGHVTVSNQCQYFPGVMSYEKQKVRDSGKKPLTLSCLESLSFISFSHSVGEAGIIPITQMRKLRFREVNWHSQEYRAQTAPTWKLEDAANSRYWLTCLKFPFLARLPGSSTPNMKLSGLVLTLHMGSLLPLPFWCPHCLYEIRESNPSLSAVLSPLLKTGQEE